MMVVAVGITSEELRLASSTNVRGSRNQGLQKCLVVTGDAGLRNRLQAAGELAGWTECDMPESTDDLHVAVDGEFQLVVVDVASPLGDRVNDTVELAEEFAARPGTLLVVCGPEDGVDEELWARQLGAWLYLPGVVSGDSLISLLSEAGRVAGRRLAPMFV